jgi:hypothetical protein
MPKVLTAIGCSLLDQCKSPSRSGAPSARNAQLTQLNDNAAPEGDKAAPEGDKMFSF